MKEDELRAIDLENDFLEEDEQLLTPEADRPLTAEEVIIAQYKMGMTLKEIVKGNGTSYGRVYEILNRNNVQKRKGNYNSSQSGDRLLVMSQLEAASLISDYKEGVPLAEIMNKYSINKHGCYTILDEAGVPRRHKKSPLTLDINKIIEAGKTEELPTTPKKKIQFKMKPVAPPEEPVELALDGNTLHIHITKREITSLDKINIVINLKEDK